MIEKPPLFSNYDVGIVFYKDTGEKFGLNEEVLRRLNHSVKLYERGVISNIICVGGARPMQSRAGAREMRDVLISFGLPGDIIFYDSVSYDSITNWKEAYKITASKGWKSVLLISSPLHLYRLSKIIISNKDLLLSVSTYSYDEIGKSKFFIWKSIHYEWIAWTAMTLMPKETYKRVIK
ncbi:MAG: YdcF family protein [Candidatus Scalindua sp.]